MFRAPATWLPTLKLGYKFTASGDYTGGGGSSGVRVAAGWFEANQTTCSVLSYMNAANFGGPGGNNCGFAGITYTTAPGDSTYLANGNYACVTSHGSAETITDLGVGPSTTSSILTVTYNATPSITCKLQVVGGSSYSVTNTTNLPSNTLGLFFLDYTLSNTTVNVGFDKITGFCATGGSC